ncbi:MAG: tocopherol cyclase family protein [Oscillospiraceae bacterium]|nr:tocopherol cyclase family protein [Oscillospiraceae bacterium]
MGFERKDPAKNELMLTGPFRKKGYDWWWHSFTAINEETGEEKPFFIEFFICNPALAQEEPTFGQLPENKGKGVRPSYLMVKAGCWGDDHCQLHRFFPWKDVKIHGKTPYSVEAGDCFASDERLTGSISISAEEAAAHPEWMCDSGELSWDLKIEKRIAFNVGYGTSKLLRFLKAFEMYWHAEGMKSTYRGTITLNGAAYRVIPEKCYGYADKNWGRNFTSPWVWLSSNHLVSNLTGKELHNSVFDIGGGRPKIYFVPLNCILLGAFYYEGASYEFNFSKFWTGCKTDFTCQETEDEIQWHVRQENRQVIMETDVHCNKTDMLLVNYEAPDGTKRHNRLWNGGNGAGRIRLYRKGKDGRTLIDDIAAYNIGCEYGEYQNEY